MSSAFGVTAQKVTSCFGLLKQLAGLRRVRVPEYCAEPPLPWSTLLLCTVNRSAVLKLKALVSQCSHSPHQQAD